MVKEPMRSFISSVCSTLFFFIFLLPASATGPDIIASTCKKCANGDPNVDYSLCVASLSSVPRSHRADLKGLTLISLKLAIKNATNVRSQVRQLLKMEKTMDRYVKSCLETCKNLYSSAVFSMKDAEKAIKSHKFDDVNVYLSVAVDAPVSCEDGFGEGGFASPLTKENRNFFKLAVISLAISSLLGK